MVRLLSHTHTLTLTDQIKFAPRLHREEMVADDVKVPVAASVNVEYGESSFADYRVTADQRRHWTGQVCRLVRGPNTPPRH